MKRTLHIALALALVLSLAMGASAYAEVVKTPAEDGSLNVRSGPGTNYSVASWVKNGQSITVLENTSPWAKIKVDSNGKIGYIKSRFIVADTTEGGWDTPDTDDKNFTYGSVTTKYSGSVVNVRKGPGTSYAVAAKAPSGSRMSIFGESGNWYLVRTANGVSGYISKNYVKDGSVQVTTANVNFREGAGTSFTSTRVLPKGTKVTSVEVSGNWTKATVDGTSGYVYSKYLK